MRGGSGPYGQGEAAHERVHGVVARAAAEDGAGKPQNAQLRDQQAAGRGVEAAHGRGEAAVHRRGQAAARSAHEGVSRLQVQAAPQDQAAAQEGRARAQVSAVRRGSVVRAGAERQPARGFVRLGSRRRRRLRRRAGRAAGVRAAAAPLRPDSAAVSLRHDRSTDLHERSQQLQPDVVQQQPSAAEPRHVHGEGRAGVPLTSNRQPEPPPGGAAGRPEGHDQHVHPRAGRRGWGPQCRSEGLRRRAAALPQRHRPAHAHLGLEQEGGGAGSDLSRKWRQRGEVWKCCKMVTTVQSFCQVFFFWNHTPKKMPPTELRLRPQPRPLLQTSRSEDTSVYFVHISFCFVFFIQLERLQKRSNTCRHSRCSIRSPTRKSGC